MVKLALIGCGKWGHHYLKTLTSIKGCELRWVSDLDLTKLEEEFLSYPQVKFTENKEDIFNDSAIKGVAPYQR